MRSREKVLYSVTFITIVLASVRFGKWSSPPPSLLEEHEEPSSSKCKHFPMFRIPLHETQTKASLVAPLKFGALSLGSIKPRDWLAKELQASADGLAGHEYEFYQWVAQSPWLGGTKDYSSLHEAFPYWFRGLVPLAYSIKDDQQLKSQVHAAADYVLQHQQKDGWFGPEEPGHRGIWGTVPLLLGLTGLAEANATFWEERVVKSLRSFVALMHEMLLENGKGYISPDGGPVAQALFRWGRLRAADMMLTLQWMYERHPGDQSAILWECMEILNEGMPKWDGWPPEKHSGRLKFDEGRKSGITYRHGVNFVQSLKAPGVIYRFTKEEALRQVARERTDFAYKDHAAASGAILGDEHISDASPYRGSELCTVVETMFSLSSLYQSFGDNSYADRAELTAFNALPAMVTRDWWAHQYVSQANQPNAIELDDAVPFDNVDKWAATFGLEPTYPCCTVNFPQGLPKFLAASWMTFGETGLAHVLLSPSTVKVELASGGVEVRCETVYPFEEVLRYSIVSKGPFDFYFRVPGWAALEDSSVTVGNGPPERLHPDSTTGMHRVSVREGESQVTVTLDASIRIDRRMHDSIAVYRGALLYALEIEQAKSSTRPKKYRSDMEYAPSYAPPKSVDWQLKNNSAWNFAVDPSTVRFIRSSTRGPKSSVEDPFFFGGSSAGAHVIAKACEIEWQTIVRGVPGVPPDAKQRRCLSSPVEIQLVPYGSAKLHISELPTIDLSE